MAAARPAPPAALTSAEQDVVLRNRIANPEKGLKTLLRRLGAIAGSRDEEVYAREVASFSFELEAQVLGLSRMERVAQQTCASEMQSYTSLVASIQQERHDTTETIQALKRELVEVQKDRQNKLEYDALAGEILKVGTRTDLEAQLTSLREAIETLTNESRKYSEVMASSQQRFEGIASQLEALRADVGFEVGERERRAVERDAGEGEQDVGEGDSGDDEEDKKRTDRTEDAEEGADDDADGRPPRSSSRRASAKRNLDPSAPSFQPQQSAGGTSRSSTPSASSKRLRTSRRAGADDDAATTSRKRTARSSKDADTPMNAVGEEDEEEEEGAA